MELQPASGVQIVVPSESPNLPELELANQQSVISSFSPDPNRRKVPGVNPAHYCQDSDPQDDIMRVSSMNFYPSHPRVGEYFYLNIIGDFLEPTGDVPWLNITGTVDGKAGVEPMYYAPLCDIRVFQDIKVPRPDGRPEVDSNFHRSCPPGIKEGYAVIDQGMPLYPIMVPTGTWEVRAEATTQDGRSIFCFEAQFNVTEFWCRPV